MRRVLLGGVIGAVPGGLFVLVVFVLEATDVISSDASQIGFLGLPVLFLGTLVGVAAGASGHPHGGMIAVGALLGYTVSVMRNSGQEPEPWKPTPSIVDTGPFGWSRNPIYLSMALMHVGVGVAVGSVWVLAMVLPACAVVHALVIRREEAFLERKFGQAYLDYRRRVRPWL